MKYSLLIIANKPGVSVAMQSLEFNTQEAVDEAVHNLRRGLENETGYSVRYFINHKGEQPEC